MDGAVALGVALQLCDWANCVGHHFSFGQRNVPVSLLKKHGVKDEDIAHAVEASDKALTRSPGWQALMQELLAPVFPLLLRATAAGERLSGPGRFAVRVAVKMARRVAKQIEDRGYDSLTQRAQMFSWRTAGDITAALVGA